LPSSSSITPLCGPADLTASWTSQGVRAENISGHPCALAGTHPVIVSWWRLNGPDPAPASGILAPRAALIQGYHGEGSNGCPPVPPASPPTAIGVSVEGHIYPIRLDAQQAHEITQCDVVSALTPTIQTPS
jgi:hypothetical protein